MITCRHVVKRAMWFHMIRPDAEVIGNSLKNTELVRDRLEDFSRTDRHLFAAEICPVKESRMPPNRLAISQKQNRAAAGWDLNRAGRNCLRDMIDIIVSV